VLYADINEFHGPGSPYEAKVAQLVKKVPTFIESQNSQQAQGPATEPKSEEFNPINILKL
jgi:hypothetical protein